MTDLTALADAAVLMAVEHGPTCPDWAFWSVQRLNLSEGDPAVAVRLAETYLTGGREVPTCAS